MSTIEPRAGADPARPDRADPVGTGEAPNGPAPKRRNPSQSDPKRPYHLGVAVGLTTSMYAATLLLTTRLQIEADRGLMVDRDPVQAAIQALGSHHDSLTDLLDQSREQYNAAIGGYNSVLTSLDELDRRLAVVGDSVGAAERLGASISANLSLPPIPSRGSSSGSASSGKGGGGGGGGGTSVHPPVAAPPAPPAPPTSGSTGASGAP